jgi:hypothetical protein
VDLLTQRRADAVPVLPGEARHGTLDVAAEAFDLLEDGRLDRHVVLLERRKLSY